MDTVALILHWSCLIAIPLVLVSIAVKLFINGASAEPSSWTIIFKAAVASGVWMVATVWMIVIWVFIGFRLAEKTYSNRSMPVYTLSSYIWMDLSYLILGCGLVYWVWRKEKINLP